MSSTEMSSFLTNKLILNMYTKKPKINEDGDIEFRKNGLLLFCGLTLFILFFLCSMFMDYYVSEIIKEEKINVNMTQRLYIIGYSITTFFTLLGLYQIIIYYKHILIVCENSITQEKMFSIKTIMLHDIETIKYSPNRGIVIISLDTKIAFGALTNGLVEFVRFIESNIPKSKYGNTIRMAYKVLNMNGVSGYKIL